MDRIKKDRKKGRVPFFRRAYLLIENIIMTILVPQQSAGPLFHWVFKIPLLLQKIGLTGLIPRNVLILTTRGRRTGRPRRTPMEYGPGPHGEIMVMSGWEGRTDWCRNLRQDPKVRVWTRERGREWDAVAEPAPYADVAQVLKQVTELSPAAARMFSRWGSVQFDGSEASYLAAAPHFPSYYLVDRPPGGPAADW